MADEFNPREYDSPVPSVKPVPAADPSSGVSDAPGWTKGTWSYTPLPGYQYIVVIEDEEGPDMRPMLMLVAHGVPAGREAEVKANLTLAAQAPDLYTALWQTQQILGNLPYRDAFGLIEARLGKNADVMQKARGSNAQKP